LNEGLQTVGTQHPSNQAQYIKLTKHLKDISGMSNTTQLIMFMTGPGGSGKTRVINAVLAYAKGLCKELNYMFDKRMIVVTALTGVAATLINGETIHSAAKFCNKKIKVEHIDEWKNT
jgi:type II secretory pathway predicted ATPase ExeA